VSNANITEDQISFLNSYRIDLSELFDASGMRKRDYQRDMEKTGQHFAFGVKPCKKGGHTIRTKYGHCVQCEPARLSYMLRHRQPGDVYIAGSQAQRLIKIGSSTQKDERLYNLNLVKYGGASDWEILVTAESDEAGKIEARAQERLSKFKCPSTYFRSGMKTTCYELFRCSYTQAKTALVAALPKEAEIQTHKDAHILTYYEF
jgi:hypothetical protein